MSISNRSKTVAFAAITLLLVACSADSEPAAEMGEPDGQSDQLAKATTVPTEVAPTVVATDTPSPAPTKPPAPPTATLLPSAQLPDLGPAPDITNEVWLNTDGPLNLASLKGEVVLVEFWTFG